VKSMTSEKRTMKRATEGTSGTRWAGLDSTRGRPSDRLAGYMS
jgi:hypothetical protein